MKNKLKKLKFVKWYQWVILGHVLFFMFLFCAIDNMQSFWDKMIELGTYKFMGVEYSYHMLWTMMHFGFIGTFLFTIGFLFCDLIGSWMTKTIKKGVKESELKEMSKYLDEEDKPF